MSDAQEQHKQAKSPSLAERLLGHTTAIYALLVWLGYINLDSYYKRFGIEIWSFMSLGDAMLSFLPVLFILFVMMGPIVVMNAISERKPNELEKILWENKANVTGTEEEQRAARRFNLVQNAAYSIAALVFIAWTALTVLTANNGGAWHCIRFEMVAAFSSLGFVSILVLLVHHSANNREKKYRTKFFVSMGTVGFWLLMCHGLSKAKSLMIHGPDEYVIIYCDQDTIVTTDSLAYIGKLSNVIFLFDRRDSLSDAIPLDQVRHIKFKSFPKPKSE